MNELLKNRTEAGKLLAKKLEKYKNAPNTIVLALPRGGVPVGYEVAHELNLPLDVFIVRKLGFPGHEEYAMGAIASNDICIFNPDALRGLNIKEEDIQAIVDRETQELKRRNTLYRQNKPMPDLHMKRIIVVDDGIATGASMKAALLALTKLMPQEIIVAVPVLPPDALEQINSPIDEVVYLAAPEPFFGVGYWYRDFPQTTDDEVIELLSKATVKVSG